MKWVILDRDGVINHDSPDYIKSVAEWRALPGSLEAIARLCQAGFRVYVATNQAGIGRGLFTYDELLQMFEHLQREVAALGGRIDGVAFAPEHPDQASELRKPAPGMLKDLARRLQLPLEGVWFIGDSATDLAAARAAGAQPVLVRTGKGRETEAGEQDPGLRVFDDLAAAATALISADAAA
jgi:D-glycero-D-manno-heptose 1,7-bisphosphate phosphatase